MFSPPGRLRAFTLSELLVAMCAIGVMAGLLLPALGLARATARRMHCAGNARQLALATELYREESRDWYPPVWTGDSRWMDLLKEHVDTYEVFDCPSSAHIQSPWDPDLYLAYGLNVYNFGGRCLWYGIPADQVPAPSRTILLGDSAKGRYYIGSGSRFRDPVQYVAYRHRKRFVAAFFDSHTETLERTHKDLWALNKHDQ